jgi:hypothetical protein
MKKHIPAALALFTALTTGLQAGAGIFDSFGIVRTTTNTYYDIGASTVNADFQGANLGTFDVTTDNLQLGGQTKTFKNSGTDVTGARIWYRIWSGTESGSFTNLNYAFQLNLVAPGDQQWGTDVAGSNLTAFYTSNLLTGLSNGNYTLEVYTEISTNGVNASPTIASNNSGNNFEATFSVIPEPSTYALLAGGLVGLMMLRRRAK